MSDLSITEFLLARIAEDEAELSAARSHWMHGDESSYLRDRYLRFNPDDMKVAVGYGRALAECEAKRELVSIAADQIRLGREARGWDNWEDMANQMLSAMAKPYADHPDYDEEWSHA